MSQAALDRRLAAGLRELGIELDESRRGRMLAYLELLARWNRAYNLTAIESPEAMVDRHLLDSLSILPWIRGTRILDAGTGAGLPGVVLAIARPECHFVLVDSNGKKIRFLRQVRRELGLDNIEPVQARIEDLAPEPVPDLVVARALAPLPRLVGQLEPFLARGAGLLAMKGRMAQSECAAIEDAYNVEPIELEVPGTDAVRYLVMVNRK
ncbi:MAG: 16S rRNA (guanine(527)-N(7))-methyltransferase RsmG [Wenzhouxiangella sp.]